MDIVGPYHLWVVVTNEHIKLGKENPSSVLLKNFLNHVGFWLKVELNDQLLHLGQAELYQDHLEVKTGHV